MDAMNTAKSPASVAAAPATNNAAPDPFQLIEKLGDLLKKGLITQDEFDKKKADLLSKIGQ